MKFLSSDDAHDLFSRTLNFAEIKSSDESLRRRDAVAVLEKAAKDTENPRLAVIAQSVRLDAFTKVKKAIDDMVNALLKEKEDEIKHRDFCIEGLNENEKQTTSNNRDRDDLLAKIDDLSSRISTLEGLIKDLKAQITEAQVQLKRAGEDREKQNLEFQKTVQDQRATVKLLNQAMNVLKSFYEKAQKGVALTQQPVGPPPPAGFKSYENNAASGGVIAMITQIVNDAKAMEAEATHDEEDAQKAYESFVKETNNTVTEKNKDIVNKTSARATAEGDKVQAETDLANKETQLSQLSNESADLHKSCDFVVKNFDIRQEGRDQEVEALRQAKAILSGAKFNAFLQKRD